MPSTSSSSCLASGRACASAASIHVWSCGETVGANLRCSLLTNGVMGASVPPQPATPRTPASNTRAMRFICWLIGSGACRVERPGTPDYMSSITAGRAAARGRDESWYSALGASGRRAFRAAFAGYMLDAFDLIVLTLSLSAIGATFNVGTGATGALSTVTLSASAIGGILGGVLADRIGRARTLMLTVAVYSVFTFLSGLATSYAMLMVFRVFQGIGFGGEWGVGAVLVAELVRPESRGRALGI